MPKRFTKKNKTPFSFASMKEKPWQPVLFIVWEKFGKTQQKNSVNFFRNSSLTISFASETIHLQHQNFFVNITSEKKSTMTALTAAPVFAHLKGELEDATNGGNVDEDVLL